MGIKCRLVDYTELSQEFEKQRAAGKVQYRNELYVPGFCWFAPWYVTADRQATGDWLSKDECTKILSIHYMDDWHGKRFPLVVICPDGSEWMVDQKSSNGTGWTVTGEPPIITCAPSIVVDNYHGFLRNGEFTDDLEGRTYSSMYPYTVNNNQAGAWHPYRYGSKLKVQYKRVHDREFLAPVNC